MTQNKTIKSSKIVNSHATLQMCLNWNLEWTTNKSWSQLIWRVITSVDQPGPRDNSKQTIIRSEGSGGHIRLQEVKQIYTSLSVHCLVGHQYNFKTDSAMNRKSMKESEYWGDMFTLFCLCPKIKMQHDYLQSWQFGLANTNIQSYSNQIWMSY